MKKLRVSASRRQIALFLLFSASSWAADSGVVINGATGIAVGMSTSIPPHNLGEVIDALKYMLENWTKLDDISIEDLMRFIQGPGFPHPLSPRGRTKETP